MNTTTQTPPRLAPSHLSMGAPASPPSWDSQEGLEAPELPVHKSGTQEIGPELQTQERQPPSLVNCAFQRKRFLPHAKAGRGRAGWRREAGRLILLYKLVIALAPAAGARHVVSNQMDCEARQLHGPPFPLLSPSPLAQAPPFSLPKSTQIPRSFQGSPA